MAKKPRKYNLKARLEKNEERRDTQNRIRQDMIITPPSTPRFRKRFSETFSNPKIGAAVLKAAEQSGVRIRIFGHA